MNKIYVDVENVGLKFVPMKDRNFEYTLVYHNNCHNNQVKAFKEKYKEVIVDKVLAEGEQVADMKIYQLITEDFNKNSNNRYVVLSKDKGFYRYSKVTGINIKRFNLEEYKKEIVKYIDEISRGAIIREMLLEVNFLMDENIELKKRLKEEKEKIKSIENIIMGEKKEIILEEVENNLEKIIRRLHEYKEICPANKKINIDCIEKILKKYHDCNAKNLNPNDRKAFITAANVIIVVLKGKNIIDYDFLKTIKNNIENEKDTKVISKEVVNLISYPNKKDIMLIEKRSDEKLLS
ncbi:MAG: hypothetical protein ACRDAU_16560 [Clostridium sp.]